MNRSSRETLVIINSRTSHRSTVKHCVYSGRINHKEKNHKMKTSDVSRMSIRQKVGSVLNRNPTSLEAEREQAIQNFFITLQKVSF